jgi:hypothetical protein
MGSLLYLAAWACVLADQLAGLHAAGPVAGAAALIFLAIELPRQRRGVRIVFLALVATGLAALLAVPAPLPALLAALRRGGAYAAFFLALGSLREAAEASAFIRRSGAHLVAQPPGRRILAMLAGGHVFGIILSYGAIDLLGAMVGRANPPKDRLRPMLISAFRGFATMNCWSPLNIMTAVVSAAVPAANMRNLIPLGFAAAMAMLAIAWLLERRSADEAPAKPDDTWRVHLRLIGLVALVMALAEAVSALFATNLSTGVTAAVPTIAIVWIALQTPGQLPARAAAFRARIPGFRGEAALLFAAGFVGVALGAALPAGGIAPVLAHLPATTIPLLVIPTLLATSLLGLNPIAVVAVIGAALPDPAASGVAPATLALACMLGWGVGVGMTPMSASAIATARWSHTDPWTVTTRWNAGFTLLSFLLCETLILVAQLVW